MINATRLLTGTILLGLLYGLFGPKTFGTVFYLNTLLLEAGLFTLIIVWALQEKITISTVIAPLAAGTLNFLLNMGWPFVLVLPSFVATAMDTSSAVAAVMGLAFFGSLAAVLYCLLLDFILSPSFISYRTYLAVAVGCALAGLPALIEDSALIVPLHKALWWLLFSVGLIIASRATRDGRPQVI